jgi:DNA-binding NtrC family response regulator
MDRIDPIEGRLRETPGLNSTVARVPGFLNAIASLPLVMDSDAPVLVGGETGTGKELVARALHYAGPRAAYPFTSVNCGALSESLFLSELFGHERGAFTDAKARRAGLLEETHRGTLFLDEIDGTSPRGQVALLRFVQEGTFRPLGSNRERVVDIRIVAATNRRLLDLVRDGSFREDLYYRLRVFDFHIPPLRERPADILPLVGHFLRRHGRRDVAYRISPEAERALLAHGWPGNVRELENAVVRATRLASEGLIAVEHLGLPERAPPALDLPATDPRRPESMAELKRKVVARFERRYLEGLMDLHGGNVSRAAQAAGKDRRDLGRLLKKYGIGAPERILEHGRSPATGAD